MESSGSSRSSSPLEERQLLETWIPEPIVPKIDTAEYTGILEPHVVTSKPGKYITVDKIKCLNFGTHNYLGLADDPRLEQSSIQTVLKYGVGSCGPRAFYGTVDIHLRLEEELASFLGLQEAVLYSYGFSTIASAIPAYAKSSDIIFVDEQCNFAIQQGIKASKGQVIKFKHNDMQHLEEVIENSIEEQKKKYGKIKSVRTFLIVEGIYEKTGDLCKLRELVSIKRKYKIRLFIEESRSFGVLGATGRGITEHFNVNINDIDLMMASLENALCAYGGFCAGSSFIVDHQRLAGAGYCFSASLPPLQTQVALDALTIIRENPSLIDKCQKTFEHVHEVLKNLTHLRDISHPLSPIKLLVLKKATDQLGGNYDKSAERVLDEICERLLEEEQIAISVSRFMEDEEMFNPVASIKLIVNGSLLLGDIDRLFSALERFSSDSL